MNAEKTVAVAAKLYQARAAMRSPTAAGCIKAHPGGGGVLPDSGADASDGC